MGKRSRHQLTEIEKTHDHISIIQEAIVLQGDRVGSLGLQMGIVAGISRARCVCRGGVVQVQHEQRGSVEPGADVRRSRAMRQPEDGEDFPLHVPALLAPQSAVDEAGAQLVVHGEVGEGHLRGQDATIPSQEKNQCPQGAGRSLNHLVTRVSEKKKLR